MSFSVAHVWIGQNGELGMVLVLCSNNLSRASPIFELVSMKGFTVAFKQYLKGFNYVWICQYCKLGKGFLWFLNIFSKDWPLRFRPSQFTYLPPPNMVKNLLWRHLGTNKGNILFTHALLRHLSPTKAMSFSECHVCISQYGKLGKGLLWFSNNFSRASPFLNLVEW